MSYPFWWRIHVAAVTISITLFLLRIALNARRVEWRRWRWLRIGPHVVDTVLLSSAIGLCLVLHQFPLRNGWLSAKVIALLIYIVAGAVALTYGRSQSQRRGALAVALAALVYIVGVALRHSAWSWLA